MSEHDLGRQLNLPRQVVLAGDFPKVYVRRISVRVVEVRLIERVQDLDIELRAHVGSDPDLLDERNVPRLEDRATNAVDTRGEVADVARQPDSLIVSLFGEVVHAVGLNRGIVEVEAAGVEYRHVRVVRVMDLERCRIAVVVEIAKVDREATLKLTNRLHAPTTDERVGDASGAVRKVASLAEWQLIDAADRETMRRIRGVGTFLVLRIAGVQPRHPLHETRPGVTHQHHISLTEAMLHFHLRRVVGRRSIGRVARDTSELGIWFQQLAARNRSIDALSRHESLEWVG